MMSTVGLELTNFINPELTWKTVSKGSRSGSRRSRRPVGSRASRSGADLAGKSSNRLEDTSVSESEKLGVAVLGRRFGDKVEHVPIKKRRFLLRSPSPPPRALTPISVKSEQLSDSQCTSGQRPFSNLVTQQDDFRASSSSVRFGTGLRSGKLPEVTGQKLDYSEDFSGIEILADAACSNSMEDDFKKCRSLVVEDFSAQERIDSSNSTSALPLKQTTGFVGTARDLPHEEKMESSSPHSDFLADFPPIKDEGTVKGSVALRDDRLHWDLNTVMDAWEQPCEDQIVKYQTTLLEGNPDDGIDNKKLDCAKGCEIQAELGDTQRVLGSMPQPAAGQVVRGDVHGDVHILSCSKSQGNGNPKSNGEEHKFKACTSNPDEACIQDMLVTTVTENAPEESIFAISDSNASTLVVSTDECGNHASTDQIALSCVSEGNRNAEPVTDTFMHGKEDCVSGIQLGLAISLESVGVAKHDVASPHKANKSLGDDSASRSEKIDLEDPSDDGYGSDVSQENQGNIVGMENETKLQEGYESQYEDGELRESDAYCWQENETEDGEVERVDYESDNGGIDDFDATDHSMCISGKVEGGVECEKQRFSGSDNFGSEGDRIIKEKLVRETASRCPLGGSMATKATEGDYCKRGLLKVSRLQLRKQLTESDGNGKIGMDIEVENGLGGDSDEVNQKIEHAGDTLHESSFSGSSKPKSSGWDRLPEGCGASADMTAEVDDGKIIVPAASISRRELPSHMEVRSSSDGLDRKDTRLIQGIRSSNLDDSYPNTDRASGLQKSVGRSPLNTRDKIQGTDRRVDHSADYWDSKHHRSYRYYGLCDSENPGPKSVIVHSKGVYRRFIGRSPAEGDDSYGMQTGMAPVRDISTNRGRYRRYAQSFGRGSRGIRNGFHEPGDDDTESSVRVPYYLARRDRSFSPSHCRGAHFSHPHKKSQSRSRSHSPPMWLLEKERNMGLRRFSRSPDFRAEARMDRARLPFQKPDYDADFMSLPRNRFSPQHNSRWIEDRDCAMDQFRDRRSPVRMFRQNQRFDSVRVPGRLKSDDYFRPIIRPGRFTEIAAAGRGRRYDGSDDGRRKYGDRYETHPVRHCEKDGILRRIRCDAENGFMAHNSRDKDDRRLRDIPRKVREEKGHLRYNHSRMYDSGPKTFGMREYDEDASPRRGRPS